MITAHTLVTRCGGRELRWGQRTFIMGVVNATPDSFSGDGIADDPDAAARQAKRFADDGADVIDIGGESTRPGATLLEADEEMRRVVPVIERIAQAVDLPLSIDTHKSAVADAALNAGASMINDVWGLKHDPHLADLAAEAGVPIVLMHNQQGTSYEDLVAEILDSLQRSIEAARAAGVPKDSIIVDPGIGFGKTAEQSLEVLRRLDEFQILGQPLLVGTSRKSAIGLVLDLPVDQRLEGTAATVAVAIAKGADMVRVHDVRAMARVARMTDAIVRGWPAADPP
ncbi:MAG: dihydropteroate synthase [Chloroflexi bacterium]|nr:dihydropteroate synthase [Chloroflexota bacterium]